MPLRSFAACLLLLPGFAALAQPQPATAPPAEPAVRPDINETYRSPTLDPGRWAANFSHPSREAFAAREAVVAAMALERGDHVADIGAGTGIFVPLFAAAVGAEGRVYAVDIARPFLDWIAQRAAASGLANVTTILGEDDTSNLPPGTLDVIFHSDTYHHFERPVALTRDHARALKRHGELFVLDFERIEGVSSDFILGHVRAGKETVIAEIESAGFELVGEIELPELRENYLLHFRKR